MIYLGIALCKNLNNSIGIKNLIEKIVKEFPYIKNNKNMNNELRIYIDKQIKETLNYLFDSLIQISDIYIFEKLKELFNDINWLKYEKAITFRVHLRNICYDLFYFKNEIMNFLNEEKKNYLENKSTAINEAMLNIKNSRKITKYQKEMECLYIRRLNIYSLNDIDAPQGIMQTLAKIFFKCINEFVKIKKFSVAGFQQIQLDMNFVKYFFRENLIIDVENILNGFFLEIMKNCSFNTENPETFDETVFIYFIFFSLFLL